jgi:hypothetical protein
MNFDLPQQKNRRKRLRNQESAFVDWSAEILFRDCPFLVVITHAKFGASFAATDNSRVAAID